MKKEELWDAYASKNPSFNGTGSITMSAAGLRKLFDQTWEKASAAGFDRGSAWGKALAKASGDAKGYDDLFSDLLKKYGK